MSKKAKKNYTKEFKEEAIKLMKEEGYSQREVSKRLGISHSTLYRWEKELIKKDSKSSLSKNIISIEQKELDGLYKEIKRLKTEREILKKAAAFFANESN